VGDTDIGERRKGQIKDLKMLLAAYRSGIVFVKKVQ
jgi:fructose-1,6-bisphosphatase